MEVDEDQWKPRDKLLLVEAVTSAAGGGGNGAGNGQGAKRDGVNWAAVSRLLRKHIPKKRLTTPTSFGSRRCMAMYDKLLAGHGIPTAGAQSLSASNGALAEGLDRVVAALREEYMNHLRKSIELCDSEIQKSTERMTRINAGELDEELLAHHEDERRFRAAGQIPPAAASVVAGTASPPRKRRSFDDDGTSPLNGSAVAPASPLPATATNAPSSPLSPAQPPAKKARLEEPPHAEDVAAVVAETTTSTGVDYGAPTTEPPPAAPPAEAEAEVSTEPAKAVAEAEASTEPAVESAEVGEPQAPQQESDKTMSSSVPLETPTMTTMLLGSMMMVEEPLPLPVVSSLSSAPASPASLAQQETWAQQPQLIPAPDDLAASLAYHDPLLVETGASYADASSAADAAELQPQPQWTAAESKSRDAVEAAQPLRPAVGEVDAATATAPTPVTEDNAPSPLVVTTAPAEAAGPKQDSLAPIAAAPEGVKQGHPSPNAGASFSTDLLWENFETEAAPTAGAGEKGDHDAMIEEATKPPPPDTQPGPQGETQTEMDVEAASFNGEVDRGKREVKAEREEAEVEAEKEETRRRDDAKATKKVEKAEQVEKKAEEEEVDEEDEEPVVVEQKKPRGRPRRQSVNTAKRTYKRRKPAAEAGAKEPEAEAEAKTVVVIDEDDVKVKDSASGGEEAKKASKKEKRGKASVQQAKKETMKVEESEEDEAKQETKNEEDEDENEVEKTKNEDKEEEEEEEESEADDMEAEAEAAVRRVEMEGVRRVLATVKAHHYAKPFMQPVSVEDVPEYPKIIYRPMDFTTITNRIKTGAISSKVEFLRDMYLLFQNAFIFNPKGSDIYVMAATLKTLTKTEMREVDREVEVVRESFPPAARPKKKDPVSTTTTKKGASKESKKVATAAPRLTEANRKRRR